MSDPIKTKNEPNFPLQIKKWAEVFLFKSINEQNFKKMSRIKNEPNFYDKNLKNEPNFFKNEPTLVQSF